MYSKVFQQIFSSSIMEEDALIRYVWICLLVLADQEGFIDMTKQSIARTINIDEEIVNTAINKFCEPDASSRTSEQDGRRLVPIRDTFGWQVVNYVKYRGLRMQRDRREYMREYMYKKRNSKKLKNVSHIVSKVSPEAYTEAYTDTYRERAKKVFKPPSIEQCLEFMKDALEANKFFNHFTANGWRVGGRTPMKDWEAAARNWMLNKDKFKGVTA